MSDKDRTWTGTITALNDKDHTVKVEQYLFHKTFVLGDNCVLAIGDRPNASFGELRPGQKIRVAYENAHGVLVAHHIMQEQLQFRGEVTAIGPANRTVTVHQPGRTETFTLADDGRVILAGNHKGMLNELKLGSWVNITYEIPADQLMARQIEQSGRVYTGTITAVDDSNRTLKARQLLKDQEFRLATDCSIVINGDLNAPMKDLQAGQKYEMVYDVIDGVNVVTRIQPIEDNEASQNAPPSMPAY